MRTTRRWTSTIARAALFVAVAAAWILLAPISFGGQTSYVIVAGASMEPTLHQGDLVLARRAAAYEIGEIVTYHHPQVGPVIHRIIDRQGTHYTLQGDANSWTDSYAPTGDEIVGQSWLVARRAGTLLMTLRTPSGLAVLSLLFGAVLVLTMGRNNSEKKDDPSADSEVSGPQPRPARPSDGAIFTLAILAVGSLLMAVAAFTRPLTETVPGEAPFQHTGRFTYDAGAPATVYSGASLETGDPVFDALVPSFVVDFDYGFASADPADVEGTISLTLEVSEPNGWSRSLPLQPEVPFVGAQAHAQGTVDMVTIRRMISLLEGATALDRDAYRVDVIAVVDLDGQLGGHVYQGSFEPRLPFALDDFQLYLRRGDSPESGDSDPTTAVQKGFLAYSSSEPATISILGVQFPVTTARAVSVIGLLLALGGGAAVIAPYFVARRRGEAARVLAEYDGLLVSVREPPTAAGEMIEVRTFADLARLSERSGRLMLHVQAGPEHHFYVQDSGMTYHLCLTDPEPPAEAGGES
jgi:signal peptidase